MIDTAAQATPRPPWLWAAYLGASWTWCIGMFLPVLLIRDYGPWAFLIFAIPNCAGAAAMGWVMRSAAQSRAYATQHAAACRLFGYVTISFQLFFSMWILPQLVGPVGYVGPLVLIQLAFTPLGRDRRLAVVGVCALAASVVLGVLAASRGGLVWPPPFTPTVGEVAGLSLVCLLGFFTCPYLDLTFHRARQSTGERDAKIAFGVGFCVLFAGMIVLTFFYATNLFFLNRTAAALIATHLCVQMAYTVNLHAIELRRVTADAEGAAMSRVLMGLALAVALTAGLAAIFVARAPLGGHGFTIGELCYRGFMGFYGLAFPAYVLLASGRPRVSAAAWAAVCIVGLPFYWLAFLEARMAWGVVGVAAVVAAAVGARAVTPRASAARFR